MRNFFKNIQNFFKRDDQLCALPHIKYAKNLSGKVVLLRTDFNVPLGDDGYITSEEAWRIDAVLPTIQFLIQQNARVVIMSHIGRDPQNSLRPVADYMNTSCNMRVGFIPALTGALVVEAVEALGNGKVLLLENLRSDAREKDNDMSLVTELAAMADMYVNDAFSVSHREHASVVGFPKLLPSYIGFQFMDEVIHLSRALEPEHPFLAIIGGAKFETKLPLIEKMEERADTIFIGGALAHTLFKYKGYEIGTSLFHDEPEAKKYVDAEKIQLPIDVVVQDGETIHNVSAQQISPSEKIVDIGSSALQELSQYMKEANTVIWNGPLGWYEGGYDNGTKKLLDIIAASHAVSIIGGGDTVFVIRKYGMEKRFTFVSTAGGAMLDFLTHGTLPGIKAIKNTKK